MRPLLALGPLHFCFCSNVNTYPCGRHVATQAWAPRLGLRAQVTAAAWHCDATLPRTQRLRELGSVCQAWEAREPLPTGLLASMRLCVRES